MGRWALARPGRSASVGRPVVGRSVTQCPFPSSHPSGSCPRVPFNAPAPAPPDRTPVFGGTRVQVGPKPKGSTPGADGVAASGLGRVPVGPVAVGERSAFYGGAGTSHSYQGPLLARLPAWPRTCSTYAEPEAPEVRARRAAPPSSPEGPAARPCLARKRKATEVPSPRGRQTEQPLSVRLRVLGRRFRRSLSTTKSLVREVTGTVPSGPNGYCSVTSCPGSV